MGSGLGFAKIVPGTACDNFFLMIEVIGKDLFEIEYLGLAVNDRQHIETGIVLKRRILVKLVHHDTRIGFPLQVDDDPHTGPVRLIAQVRNTFKALVLDKISNTLDQLGLVHLIRDLRNDDPVTVVRKLFHFHVCPNDRAAASCPVSLFDIACAVDSCSGGKIRAFNDLDQFVDICFPIFQHMIINDLDNRIDDFSQVVRGNAGRHTNGDAAGSVHQKVRETSRKDFRFFQGSIKVIGKIDRIFPDIGHHLHRDLGETGFRITHGSSAVTVDRTEVSMSVNQHIAHIEILRHMDHRFIDGGITMGMIFTHGIAHDTGGFTIRTGRIKMQFAHGIEDTALNRFQTVSDIRQRTRDDDTHRIVDIAFPHELLKVDCLDPVMLGIGRKPHAVQFFIQDLIIRRIRCIIISHLYLSFRRFFSRKYRCW